MASALLAWLVAIPLLGLATGLRCMTPIAVLCWFAYLGHLRVEGTWASWTANSVSVGVFTVLAAAELVGDKLPAIPSRIEIGPLGARLFFAGLLGAIGATVLGGLVLEGVLLGTIGAVLGSFGGFTMRRDLVERLRSKDWPVAVAEDAVAVGCSVIALHIVSG
jgi:uncharacterized membrane protein